MRGAGRKAARRGSIRRAPPLRAAPLACLAGLVFSLVFASTGCVVGHYRECNPVPFASLHEQIVVSDEMPLF